MEKKYLIMISAVFILSLFSCSLKKQYKAINNSFVGFNEEEYLLIYFKNSIQVCGNEILKDNKARAAAFTIIDQGKVFKNYDEIISILGEPLQICIFRDSTKSVYYPLSYYAPKKNKFSMIYVIFFSKYNTIIPNGGFIKMLETDDDNDYWYQDNLPKTIYK